MVDVETRLQLREALCVKVDEIEWLVLEYVRRKRPFVFELEGDERILWSEVDDASGFMFFILSPPRSFCVYSAAGIRIFSCALPDRCCIRFSTESNRISVQPDPNSTTLGLAVAEQSSTTRTLVNFPSCSFDNGQLTMTDATGQLFRRWRLPACRTIHHLSFYPGALYSIVTYERVGGKNHACLLNQYNGIKYDWECGKSKAHTYDPTSGHVVAFDVDGVTFSSLHGVARRRWQPPFATPIMYSPDGRQSLLVNVGSRVHAFDLADIYRDSVVVVPPTTTPRDIVCAFAIALAVLVASWLFF